MRLKTEAGEVDSLWLFPTGARYTLVFGHGAGTDCWHPSMERSCLALSDCGVATLRYNFPYRQHKRQFPDPKPVLLATVKDALQLAASLSGLPLYVGGRSMGGRMASLAVSEQGTPSVRGLVFYGFPLHPAGKPGCERADHLAKVSRPMLFLQGDRDALADLHLIDQVVCSLGESAKLRVFSGADHSFRMPKSSLPKGVSPEQALATATKEWMDQIEAV